MVSRQLPRERSGSRGLMTALKAWTQQAQTRSFSGVSKGAGWSMLVVREQLACIAGKFLAPNGGNVVPFCCQVFHVLFDLITAYFVFGCQIGSGTQSR